MLTYCLGAAAAVFMVDAFVMFCAKNRKSVGSKVINMIQYTWSGLNFYEKS